MSTNYRSAVGGLHKLHPQPLVKSLASLEWEGPNCPNMRTMKLWSGWELRLKEPCLKSIINNNNINLILLLSAPLALSRSTLSRPAALDVFSNSRAEFLLVAASCAGRRLQSRESVCAILRGSALNLREQQRCFEVHSSCPLWWPALRRDFKLKMPSEFEQILPRSSSPSVYNNLAPRPQGAIEKGHH